ncbi:MAG: NADH-quinone oxidoreductase subunit M [Verrucomicrobia bacterium]|jgi:NADH-quinone oxidoreductase subunit M|nr:NADH-quinone oxidoreductase subunit M [Verrucomicrobiota bacterium]
MDSFPWLTLLTLLPLVGGIVVVGLGAGQARMARTLSLVFSLGALALAGVLWRQFDPAFDGLQLGERHAWVPSLGIEYRLGVDGLGLLMVMLTAVVVPLSLLAVPADLSRAPLYHALVLWLQAGLFGTFTALNFFHWFLFWELSLVPAFFLVKLWGGPQRSRAAAQFFIYTMVGSIGLLLSFLALFLATKQFDFFELARLARTGGLNSALTAELGWRELTGRTLVLLIFAGAFLGFAVKIPIVPFHTWLPLAYAEAPTPVTMLLTGVMSKMGVYGFLRILLPIFPEPARWVLKPLLALAVLSIGWSAFAAFAQRDLKRMLGYSSINHLGYCVLGMLVVFSGREAVVDGGLQRAAALNGVLLQMFNHGLTAATLFLFVGLIERRSGGLRGVDDFGGIRKVAPVLTGLMGIAVFSSLGLPGLNGFVGEFLIFKGAFPLAPWAAALSTLGLLVTAIFLLSLVQRVFHGPLAGRWRGFPDLTLRERWLAGAPVALMAVLGVYPQLILGVVDPTVVNLVRQFGF